MPLYEYHCQACGNDFEKIRKFSNKDLVSCSKCGARATFKFSSYYFNNYPVRAVRLNGEEIR